MNNSKAIRFCTIYHGVLLLVHMIHLPKQDKTVKKNFVFFPEGISCCEYCVTQFCVVQTITVNVDCEKGPL